MIAVFRSLTGSEVLPDSHFRYDLGGDSLTYFALVEQLSGEFQVTIDPSAGTDLSTPRDFAIYILKEGER